MLSVPDAIDAILDIEAKSCARYAENDYEPPGSADICNKDEQSKKIRNQTIDGVWIVDNLCWAPLLKMFHSHEMFESLMILLSLSILNTAI
jgi:hypothetical protein